MIWSDIDLIRPLLWTIKRPLNDLMMPHMDLKRPHKDLNRSLIDLYGHTQTYGPNKAPYIICWYKCILVT